MVFESHPVTALTKFLQLFHWMYEMKTLENEHVFALQVKPLIINRIICGSGILEPEFITVKRARIRRNQNRDRDQ